MFGGPDDARRHTLILIGLFVFAFAIRIVTIGYELEFSFGEQEQRIVNIALKMGATGDLNPRFITKGVLWYILLIEYGLYFAFGRLTGLFHSTFDFAKSYFVDHSPFYLIDRLNQLALGMLSLWLLYRLGSELYGRRGGLWALAVGSAAAYHVEMSRFAAVDMLNALFGVVCLRFLFKYHQTGRLGHLIVSVGFAAGTCSAKLHAGIYLIGVLGVLAARKEWRRCLLAGALFAVFYALWTPAVILDPLWSFRALKEEIFLRYGLNIDHKAGWQGGVGFMLKTAVFSGLTLPGIILFALGLRHREPDARYKWIGMITPMALYLAWMSRTGSSAPYLAVVWPAFTLLTAGGVMWLADRGRTRIGAALGALVILSQLVYMPGSPSRTVLAATRWYSRTEEAHQMILWIRRNIPRGSRLALMAPDTWKGRLFPTPEQLRERIEKFKTLPAKYSLDYNVGNEQMYQWILRIVESDTSVPAYHLVNLDVRTAEEQEAEMRRLNLKWVEDVLPIEAWRDVSRLDADFILFNNVMSLTDDRLRPIEESLKNYKRVAAFAQFQLFRLNPPPPKGWGHPLLRR